MKTRKLKKKTVKNELKEPEQKLVTGIKEQITNLFNYSSRKSSKSKTKKQIKSIESKNINETVKHYLTEKLTLIIPNLGPWSISN